MNSRHFFVIISVFCIYLRANASTLYMGSGEAYTTLQSAMSAMSAGDTLIIRDGTYTGSANVIDYSNHPPDGNYGADTINLTSDDVWTTIKAENPGNVIFDGQDTRDVFELNSREYIIFDGVIWGNVNFVGAHSLVYVNLSNYVKFLNCGAFNSHDGDDGHVFSAYSSTFLLYDGCYVWGSGDYAFIPGANSEKIIYRKCVVRHDRQIGWSEATIGYFPYGSRNIELQNCIYIDANNDFETYYTARPVPWEFRTSGGYELENVNFVGCIAINNTTGGISRGSTTTVNSEVSFLNCVSVGSYWGARFRYNGANLNHCTLYDISAPSDTTWGRGVYFEGQGSNTRDTITNSIVSKIPTNIAILGGNSQYNCLYGNGTNYSGVTYSNDVYIDPEANSLIYPVRIENNSTLDGAAYDSGDIGATVIYATGADGTMWGEDGYNLLQDGTSGQAVENLWPFKNEALIKTKVATYSDYGITGARGFAAAGKQLNGTDDITLTSYIWEYLGNQIPEEIYGPQHRSGGAPSSGTGAWR